MYPDILETFRDGTIFITGSTGFLGKVLTEKLLRSCTLRNIALLVKSKKGISAHQRITDMFSENVFDRLRMENPDFMNSIKIIVGNIEDMSLGLSLTDRHWIIENVNFVFHCAATIKFNETLERATQINIQGTKNLLEIATEIKNLKGFVHVSTAYSHCPRDEIKEQLYDIPITVNDLKNYDDESISKIKKKWPNTYTFTKAMVENMISKNQYKLPISIFRPAIIGASKSEPYPGWVDNYNGASIITTIIVGLQRVCSIKQGVNVDIIPVDYTVNALISVMWVTVNGYQNCPKIIAEPKIYNYVSSPESPILCEDFIKKCVYQTYEAPPLQLLWYPFFFSYTNLYFGNFLKFFLHWVPAVFIDILLFVSGNRPKMLKMSKRAEFMVDLLYLFTTKQWKFDNTNMKELWLLLSENDRNTFWFSFEKFDWIPYTRDYYYGIRKYLLREDLSNIKMALSKYRKLYWLHQLCVILILCVLFQICRMIICYYTN